MSVLRRALPLAALSLAPLLVAAPAAAQERDAYTIYGEPGRGTSVESPQDAAFEFRIGRYVPKVDDEFETAKPYETTFGTKNRYSIGFELDWQAVRIPYLGTLGPGFGAEYTKISAPSFITSDRTLQTRSTGGETSSLTIFPLYVVAVLRADYLARQVHIPIVPYAKLGLGSAFWFVGTGDGTANASGVKGRGFSYGPQFALGAMLLLDALDPTSAKDMDISTGVNNSYLFAEWFVSDLNAFGAGGVMQVGTNTWVLGLALEM